MQFKNSVNVKILATFVFVRQLALTVGCCLNLSLLTTKTPQHLSNHGHQKGNCKKETGCKMLHIEIYNSHLRGLSKYMRIWLLSGLSDCPDSPNIVCSYPYSNALPMLLDNRRCSWHSDNCWWFCSFEHGTIIKSRKSPLPESTKCWHLKWHNRLSYCNRGKCGAFAECKSCTKTFKL